MKKKVKKKKSQSLLRILEFSKPYFTLIFFSVLFALIGDIVSIAIPIFIKTIIDKGIGSHDNSVIFWGIALILSTAMIRAMAVFFSGHWTEKAGQGAAYLIRNALHEKIHQLSFHFHDTNANSQLITTVISDVEPLRFYCGRSFMRITETLFLIIGFAIAMMNISMNLALLILGIFPFLFFSAFHYGKKVRGLTRDIRKAEEKLTTHIQQNLKGSRIVKAFAQETQEVGRFSQLNQLMMNFQLEQAKTEAFHLPLMNSIIILGIFIVLIYGGSLTIQGQLSIGSLVAFITYLSQLAFPVRRLGMIISFVAQARSSSERVYSILDKALDISEPEKPVDIANEKFNGRIEFQNVSFQYIDNRKVLKNINFTVYPGETLAILGSSGSGKSSIIALLPRFYDPCEGKILIDGYPVDRISLSILRKNIGILLQETILFASSIRENILFGTDSVSEDEMINAAKAAAIHDYIDSLPEKYDSIIGERGVTLSGGQKQRIAIARTILTDPSILILDDATSNIDTTTEKEILASLNNIQKNRTSIIIAQRLSTILNSDAIMLIDSGEIHCFARGNGKMSAHKILLNESSLYKEIMELQILKNNVTDDLKDKVC